MRRWMQNPSTPAATVSPSAVVGAALLAVASLGIMANATVAPALPGLTAAFRDTPQINTLAGLVITLPSLGIVLTAAVAGWLCDRFGRQRVMLASLVLYGLAGLSALAAQTLWQVLIGRMLLGIAIGGTMTSSISMIGDMYQGAARIRFMSTQAAVMSASSMVFLVVGGLLGELGWRYPFLVYAAGFMMIPVALALLSETRPAVPLAATHDRIDLKPLLMIGATAILCMALYYLMPTRLPFHLQSLGVTSPTVAGLAIATGALTMSIMALSYSRTGARLPPYVVYAVIFALTAVGYGLIAMAESLPLVFLGAAIAGAGNGWLFPINNILIMERTPPHQRGRGTGFHTTCIFSGQFLSPVLSGPLVDRISVGGTFGVFAAAAGVLALGFVATHLVNRRSQRRS
jgi:MFS family permease